MDLKLVKENEEILRKVTVPWDFTVDGDPSDLVRRMSKVMIENNGIGLAGPQVGVDKRIFVMGNADKLYACINPEILEGEGQIMDKEGCLSFPDLWLNVKRQEKIKVRYFNALGEEVVTEFKGLIARVFQHERDHLDGVCFDTKVGPVALDFAKQKRKKRLKALS